MERLRAVLLDVGGTLFTYDNLPAVSRTVGEEFARLLGLASLDFSLVAHAIRAGQRRATSEMDQRPFYLHRAVSATGYCYAAEALGRTVSLPDAEALSARWWSLLVENLVIRKGAAETLAALHGRGFHIGVVSNVDEENMGQVPWGDVSAHIDSYLTSEAARSCKPHRGIFEQALRQANCGADEAVYVGDSPAHDVAGAKGVGMRAVLIQDAPDPPGDAVDWQLRPDVVIRELAELLTNL